MTLSFLTLDLILVFFDLAKSYVNGEEDDAVLEEREEDHEDADDEVHVDGVELRGARRRRHRAHVVEDVDQHEEESDQQGHATCKAEQDG